MRVNNSHFELDTSPKYFGCHGGLFEDGQYIDTSKQEGAEMDHHDVIGTISRGYGSLPAPDFLNAFPYRCLSERAIDLFRKEQLTLWKGFHWVPVRIVRQSGKSVARYWWAKFDRRVDFDVFDYEHSKYTKFRPEDLKNPKEVVADRVSNWVLRGNMIGSLDFFHGCLVRWYGSLRLKQLVETHKLRGFNFTSVGIWLDRGTKRERN